MTPFILWSIILLPILYRERKRLRLLLIKVVAGIVMAFELLLGGVI